MKTMRFLKQVIWGLIVVAMITSCSKEEGSVLDAIGDVYIMTKVVDGETLYAPVFYVRGSNPLEEVVAYKGSTNSNPYELSHYYSYFGEVFKYIPGESDFLTEVPEIGTYTFEVTDIYGKTITVTDELEGEVLSELEIEEVTMVDEDVYRVEWEEVEDAVHYKVNIYDENNELVFQSDYISGYYTEFLLSRYKDTWLKVPEPGDSCRMEVWGILYEENFFHDLHKQCISAGSIDFEWGI